MSDQLVRYDAACKALALAKTTDEAKHIRNVHEAMRIYAKQAQNKTLEIDATEIRIRAERRLGELIAAQKATVGLAKGGGDGSNQHKRATGSKKEPVAPTLKEAGIEKKLSMRAQQLAKIPAPKFDRLVEAWRGAQEKSERVTTDLQRANRPKRARESDDDADHFSTDTAVARVVHSIRTIAAEWPDTESVDPLVKTLRREADRLEQRQARREKQAS